MIIYGINSVVEALRAGRVREIRIGARDDDRLRRLLDEAAARNVRIKHVTRDVLDRETDGAIHQGIVADVTGLPEATLRDLARPGPSGDPPLIVVLDGVEDPQNVGA